MTLTYLGPTVGAGDLIVPAASEVALDPLLAAAVVVQRMASVPSSYVDGGAWVNEGTGGTALDLDGAHASAGTGKGHPALVRPTDPAVFAVHADTNVVRAFTTPDSAAVGITGDIDLRAKWRAIGNTEALENRSAVVGRIQTLDTGVGGYDDVDYELSVDWDGEAQLIWTDSSDALQGVSTSGAGLDPYSWNELKATLDVDNGAGGHTTTFYEKVSGSWVQIGSPIVSVGTTDIRDNGGPLMACDFATMVEYVEVRSGIDGTLAASFYADDAASTPLGQGATLVSSGTGETWTCAGMGSAIFANERAFVISDHLKFMTTDDALLDAGTADRALAFRMVVPAIADGSGEVFAQKVTGQIGAPAGAGWQFLDINIPSPPLDGFGIVVGDGNPANAKFARSNTGWTVGEHAVVINLDRDGNGVVYVDGTARGTAALTGLGSISTSTDVILGAGEVVWLCKDRVEYDRVLTTAEVAELSALLGA